MLKVKQGGEIRLFFKEQNMNKQQRIAHNAQSALNKLMNRSAESVQAGVKIVATFSTVDDYNSILNHLKAIIELADLPKHDKNHS
jgi:precorrin-6B methylase 2